VAFREINAHEAKALLDAGGVRLVDCREADEFAICKIEGAELIPLSVFADEAPRKLADMNATILVYCHHGMRSARAAQWLDARGCTDVISLAGGIEAWSREIDPAVPRY
jgi:adenylyltransferase/sulfurtransferase